MKRLAEVRVRTLFRIQVLALRAPLLLLKKSRVYFLLISYQIMLRCWEENPVDRPTFDKLRKTMKEMERNHKVRGSQKRVFRKPLVCSCKVTILAIKKKKKKKKRKRSANLSYVVVW